MFVRASALAACLASAAAFAPAALLPRTGSRGILPSFHGVMGDESFSSLSLHWLCAALHCCGLFVL
jgi:hypothetical protein